MKTPARFTRLGGLLVVLALSCTPERPDPGSDLPPLATDASSEGGNYPPMQPGSALSGRYVAATEAKTLDGVVNAKLNFIFVITQTGVIADGTATLSGSLHIDQLEAETKKDFTGVPVTKEGVFAIEVKDMLIPKSVNALLNQDVKESVVRFRDAHVITSCEFQGEMAADLINVDSKAGQLALVEVFGPFTANGQSGPCGDGGEVEAGDDAESGVSDAAQETAADSGADAAQDADDAGPDVSEDGGADGSADSADDAADAQEGS